MTVVLGTNGQAYKDGQMLGKIIANEIDFNGPEWLDFCYLLMVDPCDIYGYHWKWLCIGEWQVKMRRPQSLTIEHSAGHFPILNAYFNLRILMFFFPVGALCPPTFTSAQVTASWNLSPGCRSCSARSRNWSSAPHRQWLPQSGRCKFLVSHFASSCLRE